MQQIIGATQADYFHSVLSGRGNFRKKINPDYKANRKDSIPPHYLQDCRKYVIEAWNAEVTEGMEADDLLGIMQTDETIIASLDKDLLMIPGWHYNWIKQETTATNKLTGIKHLYKQALIGDKADNIIGITGIGKVKAAKLIDPLETEKEMFDLVRAMYDDDERFVMNMCCLYIMQEKDMPWSKVMLNQKKDLISADQSLLGVITKFDSMIFS